MLKKNRVADPTVDQLARELKFAGGKTKHLDPLRKLEKRRQRVLDTLGKDDGTAKLATRLGRCRPGKCGNSECSSACQFGEGAVAAKLLRAGLEAINGRGVRLFQRVLYGHDEKTPSAVSAEGLVKMASSFLDELDQNPDYEIVAVGAVKPVLTISDVTGDEWSPQLRLVVASTSEDTEGKFDRMADDLLHDEFDRDFAQPSLEPMAIRQTLALSGGWNLRPVPMPDRGMRAYLKWLDAMSGMKHIVLFGYDPARLLLSGK